MKKSFALASLALLLPLRLFAGEFTSPRGGYKVTVDVGAKVRGVDALPMSARLTPTAGGDPVTVRFQLIRNTVPSDQTLAESFLFSADESAVVVQNAPSDAGFGYRVIPLKRGLPWKRKDILGRDGRWVDNDRLVYRGDAENDGYFIGVLDARTGRTRVAHTNLSSFTSYEITKVTPSAIHFREETRGQNDDRCYAFNTATGARTPYACPQ